MMETINLSELTQPPLLSIIMQDGGTHHNGQADTGDGLVVLVLLVEKELRVHVLRATQYNSEQVAGCR